MEEINAEEIGSQVREYVKTVGLCMKGLPGNMVVPELKGQVEDFKTLLPVVQDLRREALRPRHWAEIEEVISHKFDKSRTYTLGDLLGLNVMAFQEEIQSIAVKAVQELSLLELFESKVTSVWKELEFIVMPHKESRDVFIMGSPEEVSYHPIYFAPLFPLFFVTFLMLARFNTLLGYCGTG